VRSRKIVKNNAPITVRFFLCILLCFAYDVIAQKDLALQPKKKRVRNIMRSTFSVLFYVNKGKEKNGMVPVMGRITVNGTQSQFSCKHNIPLDKWDVKGNCAKGRSKEALQLNRDLDRSATKETLARQEHQGTDYQALSVPA